MAHWHSVANTIQAVGELTVIFLSSLNLIIYPSDPRIRVATLALGSSRILLYSFHLPGVIFCVLFVCNLSWATSRKSVCREQKLNE